MFFLHLSLMPPGIKRVLIPKRRVTDLIDLILMVLPDVCVLIISSVNEIFLLHWNKKKLPGVFVSCYYNLFPREINYFINDRQRNLHWLQRWQFLRVYIVFCTKCKNVRMCNQEVNMIVFAEFLFQDFSSKLLELMKSNIILKFLGFFSHSCGWYFTYYNFSNETYKHYRQKKYFYNLKNVFSDQDLLVYVRLYNPWDILMETAIFLCVLWNNIILKLCCLLC